MQHWFERHPRVRLIVLTALFPVLVLLEAGYIIVMRVCREAYATAKDEALDSAREWFRLFAFCWREAFSRKGA
ncbi:MAG TPA: hypothetical protein PKC79_20190 [Solidesulfovibrio magneticus]|nr:hypothetical protein [Solidesulfovibrio magneticus]